MTPFQGLIAFPITPMDADGRVDCAALRRLVRRIVDAEADAIGLLGSTGSYPYLTRDERRRAIEAALAEADGRTPVIAGIGALRTDEAILLAQDAEVSGAAGGLLAPVSYTPLLEDEVFAHFQAVASSGPLPICIYNNPATTHFTFNDALIGRLSGLSNIVAVKTAAPPAAEAEGAISDLRAYVPEGFSVGYSTDWGAAEALIAGGDAWYSVLAGLYPQTAMAIRRAVQAGDVARARQLNARLAPLFDLFKTHTSLRVIYAAANLTGRCQAAPPRPILPLTAEAQARVAAVLSNLDLA
jgi:4-hydroxy-tetrahydrodipicolinate synthase